MPHLEGQTIIASYSIREIIVRGANAPVASMSEQWRRNTVWATFRKMCAYIKSINDHHHRCAFGWEIDDYMNWSLGSRHHYVTGGKIARYISSQHGRNGGYAVDNVPELTSS